MLSSVVVKNVNIAAVKAGLRIRRLLKACTLSGKFVTLLSVVLNF